MKTALTRGAPERFWGSPRGPGTRLREPRPQAMLFKRLVAKGFYYMAPITNDECISVFLLSLHNPAQTFENQL